MSNFIKPEKNEFIEYYESHTGRETATYFNVSAAVVCKYARKYELPRRSFKYKDSPNELTNRQMEIINGSLLGDACLEKLDTKKSNSRLIEKHGIQQQEYLQWKIKEFSPFANDIFIGQELYLGKIRKYCKLQTQKNPCFTLLESKWYKDRIKHVPEDLVLTPLILAVWFFDDGCNSANWQKHQNLTIYTNGFFKEEVDNLVDKLRDFGIVNCHRTLNQVSRGCKPEIYIGKSSCDYFLDVIQQQVDAKCMDYKLKRNLN